MGWPWEKKKEPEQPSDVPSKVAESAASSADSAETGDPIDPTEVFLESLTDDPNYIPTIVQFGGPAVKLGWQLKGVCNLPGDDPSQVKPCLWRYQSVANDPELQKEYAYQILF